MSAEDMLRLGTYNALIGKDGVKGVYEPSSIGFSASHKIFKGAMRTFNWEVLDVLGAPPKVSVKWRHWGKHMQFVIACKASLSNTEQEK